MRKQFISEKLEDALDCKNNKEAKWLKDILKGEAQRKQWLGIKMVTKMNKAGAVIRLKVKHPDSLVTVYEGKEECERVIMEEILVRFERAKSASVCKGNLFNLLGYYVDTQTAVEMLEGRCDLPAGME